MSFPLLIAVISETENNPSGFPKREKPWQKSMFVHRHSARPAALFSQDHRSLTLQWTNIIFWNNHIRASACRKGRGAKEKTEGCNYYFNFKILEGAQLKMSERWWGHLNQREYGSAITNKPWWTHILWRENCNAWCRSARICSGDVVHTGWTLKGGKESFSALSQIQTAIFLKFTQSPITLPASPHFPEMHWDIPAITANSVTYQKCSLLTDPADLLW